MFAVDDQAAGPHDASLTTSAWSSRRATSSSTGRSCPSTTCPASRSPPTSSTSCTCCCPRAKSSSSRCSRRRLPLIKDDQLRLDVQGFIGQEAVHSQAHSKVLAHFAAPGRRPDPVHRPDQVAVRQAAGATAAGGACADSTAGCSSRFRSCRRSSTTPPFWASGCSTRRPTTPIGTDPVMLDMLRWHGAEEVEHKAVAFDTMKHLRAGYWRQVRAQLVGDAGHAAVVDSRRAVHVLGGPVRCRRAPSRAGGTTSRGTPRFGARTAALRASGRRLLPAGFSPLRSWAGWGWPSTTWRCRPPRAHRTD